jgi:hypothetical protein
VKYMLEAWEDSVGQMAESMRQAAATLAQIEGEDTQLCGAELRRLRERMETVAASLDGLADDIDEIGR